MGQPFVGEIRMFGGNFAPAGWAFCDGSPLAIAENETLFQLIGTTFGGDGETTFNLPDLRSRAPMHHGTGSAGTTYQLGEIAGVESVTLTTQEIPVHTHPLLGSSNNASTANAQGNILAQIPSYTPYIQGFPANTPLVATAIAPAGGSQPHENMQPFLCINFIISLFGLFPSPT